MTSDSKGAEGAATPAVAGAPQFLKGIGDGFKDTTRKGEVIFVYAQELPKPYAPGQYPRVGNVIYGASTDQYDFTPATVEEVREFLEARLEAAADTAVKRLKATH